MIVFDRLEYVREKVSEFDVGGPSLRGRQFVHDQEVGDCILGVAAGEIARVDVEFGRADGVVDAKSNPDILLNVLSE